MPLDSRLIEQTPSGLIFRVTEVPKRDPEDYRFQYGIIGYENRLTLRPRGNKPWLVSGWDNVGFFNSARITDFWDKLDFDEASLPGYRGLIKRIRGRVPAEAIQTFIDHIWNPPSLSPEESSHLYDLVNPDGNTVFLPEKVYANRAENTGKRFLRVVPF